MKRATIVAAVLLGFTALAFAADFSGTWALDKSKSDPMMGRGGQAPADFDLTLAIKQSGNDLVVTRKMNMGGQERSSDSKYTLDGKESTNQGPMGRGETVAKASMSGDTLLIQGTTKSQRGEMPFKEEYTLSDGGKVLTINSTRGERTNKQVFNKK